MPARQADLFAEPASPASSTDLLRIDKARSALSPAQRRFNRLTEQIDAQRRGLRNWQQAFEQAAQRAQAELPSLRAALAEQQRALAELLAQLLETRSSGLRNGRRREAVRELLLDLCRSILEDDPDAGSIEALHDAHASTTHAAQMQAEQEAEDALARSFIADQFGEDLLAAIDEEGLDADALFRRAVAHDKAARAAAAGQAEAAEGAGESRDTEAPEATLSGAARRRQQQAEAATASLRDVYRKLVRQLHPDREADAVERERKTALMQRINQAHAQGDLLTLLSLQMEVEQLDAEQLGRLSVERLQHFNHVLAEQLRLLRAELDVQPDLAGLHLGFEPLDRPRRPQDLPKLQAAWRHDIKRVTAELARLREDLEDPRRRAAALDLIVLRQREMDAQEQIDEELLAALLDGMEGFDPGDGDIGTPPWDLDPAPWRTDVDDSVSGSPAGTRKRGKKRNRKGNRKGKRKGR